MRGARVQFPAVGIGPRSHEIAEVARPVAAAQVHLCIEGDDPIDQALGQERQRVIELGLLAREQQPDPGVAQDVAHLVRGARGIDRHAHAARREDAEVGLGPLRHVAGVEAHHCAGLVPGADEGPCAAVHDAAQLAPTRGLPPAVALDALGRAIAVAGDTFADEIDQMGRHRVGTNRLRPPGTEREDRIVCDEAFRT